MTRIRRDPEAGRTLAELIFGTILISGMIALIGTICLPGRWFFLGGVLVGAVTAVLLVINMYDSIEASLTMNEKRARSYASFHAVLRIAVTAVLLGIAVWINLYAFAGLALGVASLKLSGLLHGPFARLFARFVPERVPADDMSSGSAETTAHDSGDGMTRNAAHPTAEGMTRTAAHPAADRGSSSSSRITQQVIHGSQDYPDEGVSITGLRLTAAQMDSQVNHYIQGTGRRSRFRKKKG